MKLNKISKVYSIIGSLVVLGTIMVFILTGQNYSNISKWIGTFFILLSEVIFFAVLIGIEVASEKASQIILRAGCGISVLIYTIISIASSLMYIFMNTNKIKKFIMVQFVLLITATIFILTFFIISQCVKEKDDRILESAKALESMINKLKLLKDKYPKYNRELRRLEENLNFTDLSMSSDVDSDIKEEIEQLEMNLKKNDEGSYIEELIIDIDLLIKNRKVEIRSKKFGGI